MAKKKLKKKAKKTFKPKKKASRTKVKGKKKKKLLKPKTKLKSKKTKKTKKKKKTRKSNYQRGDLGKAIFALFDKYGVDKVTFERALKAAKKAKPDTTYGKAYFSWHRNHYKNVRDI